MGDPPPPPPSAKKVRKAYQLAALADRAGAKASNKSVRTVSGGLPGLGKRK
jgi:hypothetical protein